MRIFAVECIPVTFGESCYTASAGIPLIRMKYHLGTLFAWIIYWFEYDNCDIIIPQNVSDKIDPANDFLRRIVLSDLTSDRFLYLSGEYVTDNEIKTAHFLATQWEFNILYKMCPFISGTEQIREQIEDQIEDHYDLLGVQKISLKRKTAGFVELCGQLRFQKRWSQSPRIPVTSVLGHMLVVAALTYFALQDTDACEQRIVNGFWGGLFHDLPEVLTRDITTPVKKSVEKLDELIKKYEKEQMEEKLFPLLPTKWHQDLQYYTEDEFSNRVIIDNKIQTGLTYEQLDREHNVAEDHPIDGEIIRACDNLAAFIEASLSIRHGVTSRHLDEGVERLIKIYHDKSVGPVDFGQIFRAFMPATVKMP